MTKLFITTELTFHSKYSYLLHEFECMCTLKIFDTDWNTRLHLIAFISALLTISRKHSDPLSLNLLHHWCHINVWATNWFPFPCWFSYQAVCQHGRWEVLRVIRLLQQIWWIAQTVSSSPMQTCRRGECLCLGTFSHTLQYFIAHRMTYWI